MMTRRRPRILAIDDTPANLMTLGAALANDYDLQIATSGPMGLALAANSPPDLILLDVMMPEMDGYEVCRRLSVEPGLRAVPVVFVTALDEMDAEVAGLALGAADYITKPINVTVAKLRIRNLLEREHLRREVEDYRDHLEQRVADRTAELEAVAGAREKALTVAEHLSALKTQFINNMSHELRTPLYHVIGLSTLSQRVNDLEKAKDYAQKIRVAGERLLGIVSSVLDFSAVESGDLQVRNDAFDLPLLLVYLTERFTEKANAKGLIFEIQRPELVSQTMTGDARRLQQVLEELLGNAVKFTEQGKVIFAVVPGANRIEFVVSDSGVGMTTEQLNAGFKPFQQGDGSAQRRFGGLGLGLALTEHLAKLMGGEIAVSSKVGEGSTFRLTLPMSN